MTELLEQALKTAQNLPAEVQDDIARIVLALAGDDQPIFKLSPEDEASFAKSRAQAERREFASDEDVRVVWSKHGV